MAKNINGDSSVPSLEVGSNSSESNNIGSYADALRKKASPISDLRNTSEVGDQDDILNVPSKYGSILKAEDQSPQECSISPVSETRRLSDCFEAIEDLSLEADMSANSTQDAIYSEDSAAASDDQGTLANLPSSTEIPVPINDHDESSSELSDESCDDEESDQDSDRGHAESYPSALRWQMRENNPTLPETVTVLDAPFGGKVYLIGTAHFSAESQEDVSQTIRATHPDVVAVELCKSRVSILSLDEATLAEETKNMSFDKILNTLRENGFMQGVLYLLLVNISAHLTKQLGMAPGGEFRRAFSEAKKIPGCMVQLADRPIHITMQRTLAVLTPWQKIQIGWYMLTMRDTVSKQDIERCKQRDLLEEILAEMTGDYPELSKIFVQERDIYLTYSLQMAAKPIPSHVSRAGYVPAVVVGVVGMGHVPGIVNKWGTVEETDIAPISRIPEPSLSSRIIHKAVKYSFYGLLLYGCYRVLPKALIRKPIGIVEKFIRR